WAIADTTTGSHRSPRTNAPMSSIGCDGATPMPPSSAPRPSRRARAHADAPELGSSAVTATALEAWLAIEIAFRESDHQSWAIDPLDGPQTRFLSVPAYHRAATEHEGEAMVARWSRMGPWIDAFRTNVADALGRGVVSPAAPVHRVIDQLDDLL